MSDLVIVSKSEILSHFAHHMIGDDGLNELRHALDQATPVSGEPFGYFKAEPFGWSDCAKDDEGAIALYETPQPSPDSGEAVAWQFFQDGKWWNGSEQNNHKQNTIDAGFQVRELYTTQQPAPDTVPVEKYNKIVTLSRQMYTELKARGVTIQIAGVDFLEAMKGE